MATSCRNTTSATGGTEYRELSRNAIEDTYARAMSEARNQYTLGYMPTRPKTADCGRLPQY